MHTPSHHIRAFSLSFHTTDSEILDPETVPDSDLGPCTAQLWTTRDMRTRIRGENWGRATRKETHLMHRWRA
jgi:hypothetical protein